jgi:hypothetical protein
VSMKMAVFWVVMPYILIPDDGGRKHLWNVGKLVPDYTAQQPTIQPSLCSMFCLQQNWDSRF